MATTERRERVIAAIVRHHHVSEDGDISFVAMADAAIAACLPDRVQFCELLNTMIAFAMDAGRDAADDVAVEMGKQAKAALMALVYGEEESR